MTTAVRPRPATATRHRQHAATTSPTWGRLRLRDDDLDLDSYDTTAMERALNGDPVHLNEAEQYETARQLHALYDAGHDIAGIRADGKPISGQKEIARRVSVSARTIVRWNTGGWPQREAADDGTLRPASRTVGTLEERWVANTKPTEDGHLMWVGAHGKRDVPTFTYQRRNYQAARVAWLIKHGTEAEGSARPGCGIDLCVHPDHIEDRHIPNMPPRRASKQVTA